MACKAAARGVIDYSKWRGTPRELARERLILDELERDSVATALDRVMHARTREDLDLADTVNKIQTPWLDGREDEETIQRELDRLLENDGQ